MQRHRIAAEGPLNRAIRAGCEVADVHLRCSYPDCTCRLVPAVIMGALTVALAQSEVVKLLAMRHADVDEAMWSALPVEVQGRHLKRAADDLSAVWRRLVHP